MYLQFIAHKTDRNHSRLIPLCKIGMVNQNHCYLGFKSVNSTDKIGNTNK